MVSPRKRRVRLITSIYLVTTSNLATAKPPALWYTTCHIYLNSLLEHIADLTNRLNDGTYVQDAENTLSLRYSIIISYTTLTQIIHTMARGRPIAELPSRNHCSEALRRILVHVGELSPHELKAMDHFISVSALYCIQSNLT